MSELPKNQDPSEAVASSDLLSSIKGLIEQWEVEAENLEWIAMECKKTGLDGRAYKAKAFAYRDAANMARRCLDSDKLRHSHE